MEPFCWMLPKSAHYCRTGNSCRVNGRLTIKGEVSLRRRRMRIYGPNGTAGAGQAGPARRTNSTAFSLPDSGSASETKSTSAPRGVAGIDALMALQGVEDPTERRQRAIKRGRSALDVLDELKIGLLAGSLDQTMVQRLRTAAAELKSVSGEAGLDQVLAEIELRVEVEL